jgi:uroporphyrinogen III methyltransferase/synthase
LITLRGAEVLSQADVVVHDRLVHPRLLAIAPASVETVDVGKRPGAHFDQNEINSLLISKARTGLRVVRLKGGDPLVLGRGGEEAMALKEAGIDFEIVPGVSSAIAVPAYAGVPLTHRGVSTSFTVLTGRSGELDAGGIDWDAAAKLGGTIVLLMAVANRGAIAGKLIDAGRDASTPVMAVEWGTWPAQRCVRTTLGRLASTDLDAPATIVIGDVAALDIAWVEKRPLFGWSVAVTRDATQAPDLAAKLAASGAEPLLVPLVSVVPPASASQELLDAARSVSSYDWVVFTSANAAAHFLSLLRDARSLAGTKIAAVGPATTEELLRHSLAPDLVPSGHTAAELASALAQDTSPSDTTRALFPRSSIARRTLPEALRASGWIVDEVETYRIEPIVPASNQLAELARADAITFCSPSAVERYAELRDSGRLPERPLRPGVDAEGSGRRGTRGPWLQADRATHPRPVVACIGQTTADAATARGVEIDVVASAHTTDGLVAALIEHAQELMHRQPRSTGKTTA